MYVYNYDCVRVYDCVYIICVCAYVAFLGYCRARKLGKFLPLILCKLCALDDFMILCQIF